MIDELEIPETNEQAAPASVMRLYADATGRCLGELAEGDAPDGAVAVSEPPLDPEEQRWDGAYWQWPTRFFADAAGVYLGAFAGVEPPAGAVEVPFAPASAAQRWEGETWLWPIDLLRREARARVDDEAERRRMAHLTPGSGQVLVYQEKRREAERLAADADPDPLGYPLLSAEIGISGGDLAEVAATVLAAARAWAQIAALIEAARLRAKRAIDGIHDGPDAKVEIDAILAGIDWEA